MEELLLIVRILAFQIETLFEHSRNISSDYLICTQL